jgi:hypothetical protein
MVNPQPFFTSCVYDVCACGKEESCLCELLESYVLECGRNGVRLEWRSEGLCGKFLGVLDKKIMISWNDHHMQIYRDMQKVFVTVYFFLYI